jgi:hypothetical protein
VHENPFRMEIVNECTTSPANEGLAVSTPSDQFAHRPQSHSSARIAFSSKRKFTDGHARATGEDIISKRRSRTLMTFETMPTPEAAPSTLTTSLSPRRNSPSSRESLVHITSPVVESTFSLNGKSRTSPSSTCLKEHNTTAGKIIDILISVPHSSGASNGEGVDKRVQRAEMTCAVTYHSTWPDNRESDPIRNEAFDIHPGNDHTKGGNEYFIKLIENHMDDFEAAKKDTKRRRIIVDNIIDDIHENGGCFLSERASLHSYCYVRKHKGGVKSITASTDETVCCYSTKNDIENCENDGVILSRRDTSKKVRDFFYRFLKKRRKSEQSQLEYGDVQREGLSLLSKKRSVEDKIDPTPQLRSESATAFRPGNRRSCRNNTHQSTPTMNAQLGSPGRENAIVDSQKEGTTFRVQVSAIPSVACSVACSDEFHSFPKEDHATQLRPMTTGDASGEAEGLSNAKATMDDKIVHLNSLLDLFDAPNEAAWNPTPPHPPQRWVSSSAGGMKWFGFEREAYMFEDSPPETITGQIRSANDWARDKTGDHYGFSDLMPLSDNSTRCGASSRSFSGSHIRSQRIVDDEKAIASLKRMTTPTENVSARSLTSSNPGRELATTPAAYCRRSFIPCNRQYHHQNSMSQVNCMEVPQGALASIDSPALFGIDVASIGSEADMLRDAMNLDFLTDIDGFSPIGWKIPTAAGGIINIACVDGTIPTVGSRSPTLGHFLSPSRVSGSSAGLDTVYSASGQKNGRPTSPEFTNLAPGGGPVSSSQVWRLSPQLLWYRERVNSGSAMINVTMNKPLETRSTSIERPSLWADSSCVKNLASQFHAQLGETSLSGGAPSEGEAQQ